MDNSRISILLLGAGLLLSLLTSSCETPKSPQGEVADRPTMQLPVDAVDTSTLTGKIMCGYQGWFNCEGDGANLGWTHWSRRRSQLFGPGNVTVDLWPDVSEYDEDELYETGFRNEDGSPAKVFSSHNRKTVLRHMEWMREYGIDGAFLQRFAGGLRRELDREHKNTVLESVREGSIRSGRAYAIMYDLSGLPRGGTEIVKSDWKWLQQEIGVTKDPSYLHHNGKPIVAVWGIGFRDGRKYTLEECRRLISFLQKQGCSVMVGVPTGWREQYRDATADPQLHAILRMADVISPWTPGRYRTLDAVQLHAQQYWAPDKKWCDQANVDFLPVVFPGFSWHNMKGDLLNAIPRLKGDFFWSQLTAAREAGAEMIYVAMFDEVDEGTAIFKCSNNPPTADGVPFLTLEGLPTDHYLWLTGQAGRMLRGEIKPTRTQPRR